MTDGKRTMRNRNFESLLFSYPKELENIPTIPFIFYAKMILSGIPLDEIQPKVRKFTTKGVCKYWLFNNWMVSITKYEYARDFLSEPANPAFNRALSPEVVGKITIDLMNLLDKLVDQPFDIFKVMQRTTIQVLGKIAFSYDFKCLENLETRHDLIETYIKLLRSLRNPIAFILPWLSKLPTKSKAEFEKDLEIFNKTMLEIIQNKKEEIKKSKLPNNNG
ncbi:2984_t:CDS:2 [Entrophospora sp. SA101]|nr:2984_t:CDS:2 [Entrophospora sp. SA101]CAJ0882733.1 8920_t:CDS:2 [Entrophospora sp. SA101]